MVGGNREVVFVKCPDYGPGLSEAFQRALSIAQILKPEEVRGKRILVKPNMLTDRPPEQAVTTHPTLVQQVVRHLKSAGAEVVVGDSPAGAAKLKQVWERTGIGEVCAREGVPLISLEQAGATQFNIDEFSFTIANPVLQADYIINLCKVKSHSLTMLTAAVKNMYGAIPGYAKTVLHRVYPQPDIFGQLVRKLWRVFPPSVSIADGVIGMEGQGPSNGTPLELGFLAAAQNPFALDRALCGVLHIKESRVPYLRCAPEEAAAEMPVVKGDAIKVTSFAVPAGGYLLNLLPSWVARLSSELVWVRPRFSAENCTHCGMCVKACPVKALQLPTNAPTPLLKHELCISCSCCHEVCPSNAIRMTQSRLLKALKVFRELN